MIGATPAIVASTAVATMRPDAGSAGIAATVDTAIIVGIVGIGTTAATVDHVATTAVATVTDIRSGV